VLASLAYHIIDKKKNPGAERKEAPFLFPPPPPFSLPFFFLGICNQPPLSKKTWCEKRAKKMKGIYKQVITKLFSKKKIWMFKIVQNGLKFFFCSTNFLGLSIWFTRKKWNQNQTQKERKKKEKKGKKKKERKSCCW